MLVYVSFKINQDEIAKTICVQRKIANNTCNGRCELRKSLKKLEDNERKMNSFQIEKYSFVYIQNSIANTISRVTHSEKKSPLFSLITMKPISVSNSTFRPPLV